jgi:hypothetical protein
VPRVDANDDLVCLVIAIAGWLFFFSSLSRIVISVVEEEGDCR